MSTRLSVVMIAKNAADLLPDCLASVAWADEIVVLDSGSTDDTVDVARAAGAKVFTDTDWQGYGIQRQRAQGYATGDYVLMLDTDERITPELQAGHSGGAFFAPAWRRIQHCPPQLLPWSFYAPQRLVSRSRHAPVRARAISVQ